MEIRQAVFADAPELYRCMVEAFKDYILLIGRTPGPMLEDYSEAIRTHTVYVAEREEALLGFLLLKEAEGDFMWLDVLAVDPQVKGQGVGQALVRFAEEVIRGRGKSECRLYTHVKYVRAQSLYLHLGYEIYERVQEQGFDRYYMKKTLS